MKILLSLGQTCRLSFRGDFLPAHPEPNWALQGMCRPYRGCGGPIEDVEVYYRTQFLQTFVFDFTKTLKDFELSTSTFFDGPYREGSKKGILEGSKKGTLERVPGKFPMVVSWRGSQRRFPERVLGKCFRKGIPERLIDLVISRWRIMKPQMIWIFMNWNKKSIIIWISLNYHQLSLINDHVVAFHGK